MRFEHEARLDGFHTIAGVDEAGRGPLAGPVVVAACIIPQDVHISGINDSKQLTPRQRNQLFERICSRGSIIYGIGIVSALEIDQINILQATMQAMLTAISKLACLPDIMFVDGMQLLHPDIPCKKIIKGDARSYSIAAASILAKVTRDQMMVTYHRKWPLYGFDQHKGYGTRKHLMALKKYGPCPIHRKTFAPLKNSLL